MGSFFLTALAAVASVGFRTADLEMNAPQSVEVPGAGAARVTLVGLDEKRDTVQEAMREARIRVRIDETTVELSCGNYNLPVTTGRYQIDCPVTRGYRANSTLDHWGLRADARVRLWPAGKSWLEPGELGYPARQRWFLTHTQMSNEPTYVDRGERIARRRVYYHSGLDIGGSEAQTEVVAATDGLIVSLGTNVLEGHRRDTPVAPRYDVLYLLDSRGWYYRYSHLHSFEPSLRLGARVRKGERLGLLGKEGGSGGWSHLHFEIVARQPSGLWGTEEGYAFLWQAYLAEYQPAILAAARPHRFAVPGEIVALDASRSWARHRNFAAHWLLSDGRAAGGTRVEVAYSEPGTYSEVLSVTDFLGNLAFDFATINVADPKQPGREAPTIHATYHPSLGVRPGVELTFKVRTFGTTEGEEEWDFGDGTPRLTTRSDGNARQHDPNGYAVTRHTYSKPGDYIVRVSRRGSNGLTATTHLWVPVASQ